MRISLSLPSLVLAVILFTSICGKFASGNPELIVRPAGDKFTRALGNSIVLTCEVTGTEENQTPYNLKWFFDKVEITDRLTRIYVEDESPKVRKLYITEIDKQDEGNYRCTGEIDGSLQEKSVSLFHFKEITFDHAPETQHPAIYTDAVIECQVSGQPVPEMSWRYNDGHKSDRIQSGGRYTFTKQGLQIQNVTRKDDGVYLCRAEVDVEGRYNEQKITVAIHIPPVIVERPGHSESVEGTEVVFSCKADGLPPPEFQFYKDGSTDPVVTSERVKVDSKVGSLVFDPIKKEDEGKYTCRAYNDVGNWSEDGDIKVLVVPSIYEFENVSRNEGLTLELVCASHGDPAPNMTIQKVGNKNVYNAGNNEDGRIVVSDQEKGHLTLSIGGLIKEDAGEYICRANSKIGNDEQLARITVNYGARFPDNHPKMVYIWAGKTRNITCDVQGVPVPTIEWLRGNTPITNNNSFQVFTSGRQSSLQVSVLESDQTWIYGHYICKASNELGINEIVIELIRAIAPDSPKAVNVSECFPTGVILLVEPPLNDGGEKVTGYHVEYFEKKPNATVNIGGDFPDKSPEYVQIPTTLEIQDTNLIEIENLKPNTTYTFRVKAKNEVGTGSPKELIVTTESVRKPNPIQITSDMQAAAFSYTVTWKKPVTGGLPIEEYEIKYREVMDDGSGSKKYGDWIKIVRTDDPGQPMLTFELDQLSPTKTYDLQVRAKNELDWSDVSSEFHFQTREAYPSEVANMQPASIGTGAIVGIAVFIFVVLLVVVDISCYFMNNCGVTMLICVHLCGKSGVFTKEKAMEEGERQCLKPEDDKEAEKEKEGIKEAMKEGMEQDQVKLKAAEEATVVGKTHSDGEKAPVI